MLSISWVQKKVQSFTNRFSLYKNISTNWNPGVFFLSFCQHDSSVFLQTGSAKATLQNLAQGLHDSGPTIISTHNDFLELNWTPRSSRKLPCVCAFIYAPHFSRRKPGKASEEGSGGTSGRWQWLRCQLEVASGAAPRRHNQADGKADSWLGLALQILETVCLPSFSESKFLCCHINSFHLQRRL